MKKKGFITATILGIVFTLMTAGYSAYQNQKYTANDLNNLAQIEIYSADGTELINLVNDEETLYEYNQFAYDGSESERQAELERSVRELQEEYHIITYQYPVSRFHTQELEKNTTITLYKNSNIIKTAVSEECLHGLPLPQDALTFYYEISDEELEFYHSLSQK